VRFASALSEHPLTAHATGEVIGQTLEAMPDGVDLAWLWVSAAHAGALEDVAAAVRATLGPGVLIGAASEAVMAAGRVADRTPAVALWTGQGFAVAPVRAAGGQVKVPEAGFRAGALLLVGDPFSADGAGTLGYLRQLQPGLRVIGGTTSAGQGPGGNRLVLDHRVLTDGLVGCYIGAEARIHPFVSQGARPVGTPWTVTRAEGNMIYELGGRSALARLADLVGDGLDLTDIRSINAGQLALGEVLDERRVRPGPGDFLVHAVLGADREAGALAIDGSGEVGRVVQFHLRDADGSERDLRTLAARHSSEAAIVFTAASPGERLDRDRHAEAEALHEELGGVPLAGMSCAAQWGPVGGVNRVFNSAVSVALFGTTMPG
jgi:small ligand-binding sensory domain FIST